MKKSFFYLAAGLLTFSACSFEKTLDEGIHSNAIGFENVVGKQTRAGYDGVDITADNLKHFSVFGYYTLPKDNTHGILVFNDELVTNVQDNNWSYANTRYWVPGATYNFYAYSCGDIKLNTSYGKFSMDVNQSSAANRVLKINSYICDNTHQHDLLFASKENVSPETDEKGETIIGNTSVAFQFAHILSRVDAQFKSDFAPEYTVEISDVKISNIRNIGDYDSNANKGWYNQERTNKNTADPDPYVVLLGENDVITARKAGEITVVGSEEVEKITALEPVSGHAFVIPHTYSSAETTISFKIAIKKGDDLVLGRVLKGSWKPTWKQGYKYTYNISITGDATNLKAIVFQTESNPIVGWNSEDKDDQSETINFSAN